MEKNDYGDEEMGRTKANTPKAGLLFGMPEKASLLIANLLIYNRINPIFVECGSSATAVSLFKFT